MVRVRCDLIFFFFNLFLNVYIWCSLWNIFVSLNVGAKIIILPNYSIVHVNPSSERIIFRWQINTKLYNISHVQFCVKFPHLI